MTTTIGALTNVPNPGAPISSPWAQDVTEWVRHVFATKAALDAQWPAAAAPDGAHAYTLAEQLAWDKIGAAWVAVKSRLLGRKIGITNVSVPTGGANLVTAFNVNLPAARLVRVRGQANFSAAAGVGAYIVANVNGAVIAPRLGQVNNIGAIGGTILTGEVLTLAPAGAAISCLLAGAGIGGTATTNGAADPQLLEVYDEGPGPLPT